MSRYSPATVSFLHTGPDFRSLERACSGAFSFRPESAEHPARRFGDRVAAVGMTFVVIIAGIDLSVGAMLSLCAIVSAVSMLVFSGGRARRDRKRHLRSAQRLGDRGRHRARRPDRGSRRVSEWRTHCPAEAYAVSCHARDDGGVPQRVAAGQRRAPGGRFGLLLARRRYGFRRSGRCGVVFRRAGRRWFPVAVHDVRALCAGARVKPADRAPCRNRRDPAQGRRLYDLRNPGRRGGSGPHEPGRGGESVLRRRRARTRRDRCGPDLAGASPDPAAAARWSEH